LADHHRHLVRGQRRPAHHQSCLDLVYADPARRGNGRGTLGKPQDSRSQFRLPPSRDTRRAVLHRDGVWLLHLRAFDRHPLEEAIDRHDAAAITICLTEHRQPIDCLGVGVDRRRLRLLLAPVRDEPPPSSLTSRLASARKALLIMPDRNQRRSLEISRKHLEQDVHHRRVSPVEDRVVDVSRLKEDRRPALRRCVLGEVACCRLTPAGPPAARDAESSA
jgi:hypothetical protein